MSTPYDDGPVLPEQTRDDDPRAWGEQDESSRDEEILREVPPHHDDWDR